MKLTTTAIAALAAMIVAGCSSSTGSTAVHSVAGSPAITTPTAAARPAAHGVEAAHDTIPWSQVGPGWMLATWSPVTGTRPGEERPPNEPSRDAATTLYLVSPAGGRYPHHHLPAAGRQAGRRAGGLVGRREQGPFLCGVLQTVAGHRVDLHTGKQTAFAVNGDSASRAPTAEPCC